MRLVVFLFSPSKFQVNLDNLITHFSSLRFAINFVTFLHWETSVCFFFINRFLCLPSLILFVNKATSVFVQASFFLALSFLVCHMFILVCLYPLNFSHCMPPVSTPKCFTSYRIRGKWKRTKRENLF